MKSSDKKTLIFFLASILMGAAPACANTQVVLAENLPEKTDLNLNNDNTSQDSPSIGSNQVESEVQDLQNIDETCVSDASSSLRRPPVPERKIENTITLGELAANSQTDLQTIPSASIADTKQVQSDRGLGQSGSQSVIPELSRNLSVLANENQNSQTLKQVQGDAGLVQGDDGLAQSDSGLVQGIEFTDGVEIPSDAQQSLFTTTDLTKVAQDVGLELVDSNYVPAFAREASITSSSGSEIASLTAVNTTSSGETLISDFTSQESGNVPVMVNDTMSMSGNNIINTQQTSLTPANISLFGANDLLNRAALSAFASTRSSGFVPESMYTIGLPYDTTRYYSYSYSSGYPRLSFDGTSSSSYDVGVRINSSRMKNSQFTPTYGSDVSVIYDFVGVSLSAPSDGGGAGLYISGDVSDVTSTFVDNFIAGNVNVANGGGAYFNSGKIRNVSSVFVNNLVRLSDIATRNASGGALYIGAEADVTNIDSVFVGNRAENVGLTSSAQGGAILNLGVIRNLSGEFYSNAVYNNAYEARGGAITNDRDGYIIDIENATFYNNYAFSTVSNTDWSHKGAAIYNLGAIDNINYTNFYDNQVVAASGSAYGGAIGVVVGTIVSLDHCNFDGNSVTGYYAKGGAIGIVGTGSINSITNSTFTGNSTVGTSISWGGAIYNEGGSLNIGNSTFTNNSSGLGGAIYNDGDMIFTANGSDITFRQNTDKTGLNDIYNMGIINFATKSNSSINLYSGISGSGSLHIDGNVNFHNPSGNNTYKGGVALSGGTIRFPDGYYFSGNITLRGGTIDVQNSKIDTISPGEMLIDGSVMIRIDADLANAQSDSLAPDMVNANSAIYVELINIMSDGANAKTTTTFAHNSALYNFVELSNTVEISYASGVQYTYLITYDNTTGQLVFDKEKAGLKEAINADSPLTRIYDMGEAEQIDESIGAMGGAGSVVTVNGNGYAVNGNGYRGITLSSGQTLNINNVSSWNGFMENYASVHINYGSLNITNSTFENNTNNASAYNSGGAINIMSGDLSISDSYFISNHSKLGGGAIYAGKYVSEDLKTTTIINSSFTGNSSGSDGGALFSYSDLSLSNSIFTNNTSVYNGGAVLVAGNGEISNCTFSGNKAQKNGGGAVAIGGSTYVVITDSSFMNNASIDSVGGAIYTNGTTTIKAVNSDVIFSGNTQRDGTPNDIYASYCGITFDAAGGRSITLNGGVANDSIRVSLEKNGAGTLNISGVNNEWVGQVNINAGTLTFNKKSVSDTFFSGSTSVNSGAVLNLNLAVDDTITRINGTGTVNKNGAGMLTTNGFLGSVFNINQGVVNTTLYGANYSNKVNIYSTLNLINNNSSQFSGAFAKNGILNKLGSGRLTVSGDNSGFTGTTTIIDGSITFDKSSSSDKYFSGTTNVNGNSLVFNLDTDESISGNRITGSGIFGKNGAGTLTLSGANSGFTGTTAIDAGTIQYNSSSGSSYFGGRTNIGDSASLIFNLATNETHSDKFYGGGSFIKSGTGTLTITGTNDHFSGTTTINGGTIQYNSSVGSSYFRGRTNVNGNTLIFNLATDEYCSNKFYGTGSFIKSGSGTLFLNGENSAFTGTTTIQGGTIQYSSYSSSASSYLGGRTNVNGNTLVFNLDKNESYSDKFYGSGNFYKQGYGTMTLTGANSGFTGTTVINGGTIQYNSSSGSSYFGGRTNIGYSSSLIFNLSTNETHSNKFYGSGNFYKQGSGTLTLTGSNNGFTGTTTIQGGSIIYNSSSGSSYLGGRTNVNGYSLYFNLATNETYSDKFYGTGNFYKQGTGTLTLTGTNSNFTGTTTIQGGTIQYNSSSGSSYLGGRTNVNGNTLIFNLATNESYSNKFYGSGNFYKQGSGTMTLTGTNNAFTGLTTIQGGTIQYNSSSGSSYLGGQTNVNGNSLIFNLATNESMSGNKIYGAGNFYKQGSGTLTLSGVNSGFTGTTYIQGGTVYFDKNAASDSYFAGSTVNNGTLTYDLAAADSIAGKLSGSGTFNKTGAATLSLSGNNSGFTGTANINQGAITFTRTGSDQYFGGTTNIYGTLNFDLRTDYTLSGKLAQNGTFNKYGAATLTITGDNSAFGGTANISAGSLLFIKDSASNKYFSGNTVLSGGTLEYRVNAAETIAGKVSGTGSIIKSGSSTLTISADNSGFTGSTYVNSGRLIYSRSSANDKYFAGSTNIGSSGTLEFNLSSDLTFSNAITGTGIFNKKGASTLTLTGNHGAFGGTTIIDAGRIVHRKNSASDIYFGGTTTINNGGTLEFATAVAETLAGTVNGTGNFIKSGAAGLTMSGNNSGFTGTATISGGSITFNKTTANDKFFGGSTAINSGTSLSYNTTVADTLPSRISGGGIFNKTGNAALTINNDQSGFGGTANINAGKIIFNKASSTDKFFTGTTNIASILDFNLGIGETLASTFTGSGTFNKYGAGTLTINSDQHTFTGTTNITAGAITFDKADANKKYFSGTTNIGSGTVLNFNLGVTDTLSSVLKGTGTFNKNGAGTLTINGAQSGFTGTTNLTAGKIVFNKTTANDAYFGGLTNIGAGTAFDYNAALAATTTGRFAGTGSFNKLGSGILTLKNDNSGFSGATTISAGKLLFAQTTTNDKYFAGTTAINSGTSFDVNLGATDYTLNSRLNGSGAFNKLGAYNLTVQGDNSNYNGLATISDGKLIFQKASANDKFFTGTTQINGGKSLEYVNSLDDTLKGKITGTGVFRKLGNAVLTLTNDNRGFTGTTVVDAGKLLFDKDSSSDYYFGGTTTINRNGTLEFDLEANESFSSILNGNGTFRKTGSANLTIGGDNSLFKGTTIIDSGKLIFDKTASSMYFGGTTTINVGGELQYTTSMADTVNGTINGSGVLRKLGNSTLTLTGNNRGFTGTAYIDAGAVAFEKNDANTYLGGSTVIGISGVLNYITTINDTINGTVSGTGVFNKLGAQVLTLDGDNSAFTGTASIHSGKILYNNQTTSDSFFAGQTIVNSGTTLEFVNTVSGLLKSDLSGSGTFTKNGADILTIEGNQSGFTGTVNIFDGKMSFTTGSGKSFFNSSAINISGTGDASVLDYTYTNSGVFDRLVNLQGNAVTNLNASSNSSVTLNNLITTTGNNNITNFSNGTFVFQTDYNGYGASGTGNKITFTDTTAKLDTVLSGFGSNKLNAEFTNSIFDMRNDNGTSNAHGIGDAVFDKLTLTGENTLYIDMDLKNHPDQLDPSGEKPEADRLIIGSGSSGEIDLKGVAVTVDGRWAYEEVQIIDGAGVTIKDFAPYLTATSTNYIYEITKSNKDGYVIVSTVDYEDDPTKNPETLKVMHQSTSNRGFSVNSNNAHYMVLSNLGKMGSGEFYVSGISNTTSIIDANSLWTLFNADSTDGNARELEIGSVRIQNAVINITSGRLNGSALYLNGDKSTVRTNTTAFDNNSALSGGAVYNNGGNLTLSSSILTNNSATIDGGAVYFNGGVNKIENSELANNNARSDGGALYNKSSDANILSSTFSSNSSQHGGAVYNENVLTVTDSRFDGNTASNSGGAIYNEGTLNITASENKKNRFYNNTAAQGGDIYNDNGIINFNGKGTTEIESGISGNGQINKNDSGILNLRGENNDFAGAVTINAGKILFDKITSADSYLGGTTLINENGTLEYDLTVVENLVGTNVMTGNGIFRKTGDANLNLSGKNDAFKGEMNIFNGTLNYNQSTDGTYFGGNTSIEALAVLNFTNTTDDNIRDVSGMGTFNKYGSGTAVLTGDNTGFIGITNLNQGVLKYSKSSDSENFIKGRVNVQSGTTLELNLNKSETIGANIYGEGTIKKTGSDIWEIKGDNSIFTGVTVIDSGRVDFEKKIGNIYLGGTTTVNTNGILKYITSSADTINGTVNGTGKIDKYGLDTLTFTGDNSGFTGHALINEGTVAFEKKDGNIYLGGTTEIKAGAELEYKTTVSDTINGTLSGAGQLTKLGAQTLTLTGDNSHFTGNATIENGSINFEKNAANTYLGGTTEISADAILNYTTTLSDNIDGTMSGEGIINKFGDADLTLTGDNSGFTGNINVNNGRLVFEKTESDNYLGGTTVVGSDGSLIYTTTVADNIDGTISGTGKFIKYGSDKLTLTGDNTGFSGVTTINEGRIVFDRYDADQSYFRGTTTVNAGAELEYLVIADDIISGTVNGTGKFIKSGNGTLILDSVNNVFSGHTVIENGTINYQQSYGGSYFSSSNEIRSNGVLDFTNNNEDNINTLSSNGTLNKYGSGNLNLTKDNTNFTGTVNIEDGKITYNKTTDDDKFVTGTVNVGADTELNFNIEKSDTVNATINGVGTIYKTGNETLTLSGKNKGFTGLFDIKNATVLYEQSSGGSYFGGSTDINYGATLIFRNSSDDYIKDIKSSGVIRQRANVDSSYGAFIKEGTGNLYLSGDNSDYTGTVTINEGTLVYDDLNNKFFASSEIDINGTKGTVAKLEYTKNDENAIWNTHVNLQGDANLTVKGTGNGHNKIVVNQPPATSGNNNETVFTQGTFEFNNAFKEYGNNSTNTKITFDDMTFELSNTISAFGQSNLNAVFNNSVLNTKNDKLDTLNFGDLTLTGTNTWHIDLDLKNNPDQHLPGPDPEADKIIAQTGSGVITLGAIKIIEDGRWKLKEVQLVDAGGVILKDFDKYTQFTSNGYEYDINKSENDEGSIVISTTDYNPGEETLKKAHKFEGDRGFNISSSLSTTENGVYVVLSNLETMGAGRFDVSGLDKTQNTITGNHEWALFNADSSDGKDRILNIYDLTISDAITDVNCGRTDGSAVYIKGGQSTANIQNTIFYNNSADERGGAIYNEGGKLNAILVDFKENSAKNGGAIGNSGAAELEAVTFDKNNASNDGGAISNIGDMTIATGIFTENTAQNNGGAIHNSGDLVLTDVNFKDNTSLNGNGGAIYNDGTVTIIAGENHLVEFENNMAGVIGSDIHNENGTVNFGGAGSISINSGITGSGIINKVDSGTLVLAGKNHNYTGQTNINEGDIYFEKNADTSYLGGYTTINENGTLIYVTTENDTIDGTVNGNGIFEKYGGETLTLTGDNSGFTGRAHLYEGSTSFTKTDSSKYLGGQTTIHENAQLEFITIKDDSIHGTIDGDGYIKKSGENTLTFTGDNSKFTGLTTIDEGRVLFDKNTTDDIQLGGKILVNSSGTLEFDLDVEDTLNANMYGDGRFVKSGDATLTLNGNNSIFTGITTIKEGTIAFEKLRDNVYLGGNTIIESGATLEYKTTQSDLINGTVSGSGTIEKYGENTLFLTGDNSSFTGQTNINEGTVYFEKNNDSKYLGGHTTINQNGTLIYETTLADTINGTVNGTGAFIKTGAEVLTLTGVNNMFSGNAYFENGTVKYEQSTGGSYFSGTAYIANSTKLELNNTEDDKFQNISGLGEITKNGDGVFALDGTNKDFWGKLQINNGEISYKQTENGSYINGLTVINKEGTLRINIKDDEKLTYFTGDGNIIKEGDGTVTITDNNSAFTGSTTIDAGRILFNREYANDEYFHDKTTINENGELHFNLDGSYILQSKLDGNGLFTKTGDATLYLQGWNEDFKGTFDLKAGTVALLAHSYFFGMENFNMSENTLLDTRNGILDNINVHNISVSGDRANLSIDIDINRLKGDYFSADSFSGDGKLVIDYISIVDDAFRNTNEISIINTDNDFASNVMLDPKLSVLEGKIYRYNTSYNPESGNLTLSSAGGNDYKAFSPSILSANVSAIVGGYLMQLNSYDEAFANMDMLMLMPRAQREAFFFKNRIAANDAVIAFTPTMIPEENKGMWYRTSTSIEKVPLKNGPNVSNTMYNSYFGADSPIKQLKHGINATFSAYAGYTGSHQAYDGVSLYQNGVIAGGTAAFYYNNFFSALTASGGAIMTDSSGIWGTDHPFMATAGVASKSGYNWELLDGKFIIQPNMLVSYTFVNLFDYNNKANVNLQTKPLNTVQIVPGVKFIANLPSGWMPYINISVVNNIMDETDFKANDVALPQMSLRPYVNYGIGVQKRWGDRFTGYIQTMLRSGGRKGASFSVGLRWSI